MRTLPTITAAAAVIVLAAVQLTAAGDTHPTPLPAVTATPGPGQPGGPVTDQPVLFAPDPPARPGPVTSEYAYWNPGDPAAARTADWEMTSGTLMAAATDAGPAYWTGRPNTAGPGPRPTGVAGTNSAVFRLTTSRADFGDVSVRTKINIRGLTTTTARDAWDGIHIFLRYQSEAHLYYVSVQRRDGAILVKKKCPGGRTNGGTYYVIGQQAPARYPILAGQWKWFTAAIRTLPGGTVAITAYRVDKPILTVVDTGRGTGCAPITAPGRVGLRGDNADFTFQHFRVRQAG